MKLTDYLNNEIELREKIVSTLEKHIFDIRNGLDLDEGQERDEFTIKTLVQSKQDTINFNKGGISVLREILGKVSK